MPPRAHATHARPAAFAHHSERQLAELLDFYGIAWEYEPVEFVLGWDEQGRPNWAFRPDFYLPEHQQFLELTTLRQDLVTPKNRKVRRLAELYPDVNVRVLYRKDYANLLLKAQLAGAAPDVPATGATPSPASARRSA